MDDSIVFSTASRCFAPASRDEWRALTQGRSWQDFLDTARRLLQESAALGEEGVPADRVRFAAPLQDCLEDGELDALFAPPSWDEKRSFDARHFTGGLPASAPPIESLYRLPDGSYAASAPDDGSLPGSYDGEPARYMRALIERMGFALPPAFSDRPDHLALELDLLAIMLDGGLVRQARCFLGERLAWLPAFRMRLIGMGDSPCARFYLGLVDVLLGVWLLHASEADAAGAAHRADVA